MTLHSMPLLVLIARNLTYAAAGLLGLALLLAWRSRRLPQTLSAIGLRVGAIDQRVMAMAVWGVRSPGQQRRRIILLLLVYGLVVAVVAGWYLNHVRPQGVNLMDTRREGIYDALAVLDAGGPPLLGIHRVATPTAAVGTYYAVGGFDDLGVYVYYPWIMHTLHIGDVRILMKWVFIIFFVLLIFLYPYLAYAVFGSVTLALLTPIVFVAKLGTFIPPSELYWISAWVLLLCLPVMFALVRSWQRWSFLALCLLMLVASFASSIRINAGLPVLLAGLVLTLIRVQGWPRRLAAGAVLVMLYLAVQPMAFGALRQYRNHVLGKPDFDHGTQTAHLFWHNIYIGFGYLPNNYGLRWDDSVTFDAVRRVDPTALNSPRYDIVVRQLVFQLVRTDPVFAMRVLFAKLGVTAWDALRRLGVATAALLLLLRSGFQRKFLLTCTALVVPALAVTVLPPVLTTPSLMYLQGWLGAWALLWLLGLGGAWTELGHFGSAPRQG